MYNTMTRCICWACESNADYKLWVGLPLGVSGGSTFLIHAPMAPLLRVSTAPTAIGKNKQKALMPEEASPHRPLTPKPNGIREGGDGGGMSCR